MAICSMAQNISIKAKKKALNKILIEIRDEHKLNLSFNDAELSKYSITVNQKFTSPESAFDFVLAGLPLTYEKHGDVYLFFTKKQPEPEPHILTLKITDKKNGESLPFTHLEINGKGNITDAFGNYTLSSLNDSIFRVRVSHLGYQLLDTTVHEGKKHKFGLTPMMIELVEVFVKRNPVIFSQQTGKEAGLLRINHRIARMLPGNGDNSVFNLLRLQPGVLAAGEQANGMSIWGSYEGQSQVNFDGITLFALKNFNDNISAVNPFMAKDIRVHKGGFDATLGERVGGIVDISGTEGSRDHTSIDVCLNSMTLNTKASVPIGNTASIVGAFRQTYYDFYDIDDLKITPENTNNAKNSRFLVSPDYTFRDGNLKFSGNLANNDTYYISGFMGRDEYSSGLNRTVEKRPFFRLYKEENQQYGVGTSYNKLWEGKGSSELNMAYSKLETTQSDTTSQTKQKPKFGENTWTFNDIAELKVKLSNAIQLSERHNLKFGAGYICNTTTLQEDTFGLAVIRENRTGEQVMLYAQDKFSLTQTIDFTYGFRSDYSLELEQNFFQPRVSLAVKPIEELQFNASWGIYNQFVSLSTFTDTNNNPRYLWTVNDGDQTPVLKSQHYVFGGTYHNQGFSFSAEAFYKKTNNITRIRPKKDKSKEKRPKDLNEREKRNEKREENKRRDERGRIIHIGENKTIGIDFFVKQEYKGHSIWASYSLAQSLERFPSLGKGEYRRALQDQRHEIKVAGVANLKPFHISINYVYGSGILHRSPSKENIPQTSGSDNRKEIPYSRLDVAGLYSFSVKKVHIETGLSVLNVLDQENIKQTTFFQRPEDESPFSIESQAMPLTPTIFLNVRF